LRAIGKALSPQAESIGDATSQPNAGDNAVPKEKPLKPDDFPVHTKLKEIVTDTGKPVATACDKETAEDITDRLNSDHVQEEQDRWA
jgi:hypothetical protein